MASQDDRNDINTKEVSATGYITVDIFILMLIVPVIVLDCLNNASKSTKRDAKTTASLMNAVMISCTIFQSATILRYMLCLDCTVIICAFYHSRTIMKGINWWFLVHRVRLAQSGLMDPFFSKKWFTRIIPGILLLISSGLLVSTTISSVDSEYFCQNYTDTDLLHRCWPRGGLRNISNEQKMLIGIGLCLDVVITVLLLGLFVVPLYRISHTLKLGMLNANQSQQRIKVQGYLRWSVLLTLINQVTSMFLLLPLLHLSGMTLLLWTVGKLDAPTNVWTSWLMITRNRHYLHRIHQNVCGRVTRQQSMPMMPALSASRSSDKIVCDSKLINGVQLQVGRRIPTSSSLMSPIPTDIDHSVS